MQTPFRHVILHLFAMVWHEYAKNHPLRVWETLIILYFIDVRKRHRAVLLEQRPDRNSEVARIASAAAQTNER